MRRFLNTHLHTVRGMTPSSLTFVCLKLRCDRASLVGTTVGRIGCRLTMLGKSWDPDTLSSSATVCFVISTQVELQLAVPRRPGKQAAIPRL